jgi:hypothetical protein
MSKGIEILTKGLHEGYAGTTVVETIDRLGFALKRSHYEGEEGVYHDEWLPTRTGGGQELARSGEEKYTRLYAGGVIAPKELHKLGVTEKDVIGYLIKKVGKLGGKTRLFEDCRSESDGEWQYDYRVTDRIPSVDLTRALETIHFKDTLVFVHGFEICRINE